MNLEHDLRDGLMIAEVIKSYIGSEKINTMLQLKSVCMSLDDYSFNWQKIIDVLKEIGIQCPLTVKFLMQPNFKDLILFCMDLFYTLPYYKPA